MPSIAAAKAPLESDFGTGKERELTVRVDLKKGEVAPYRSTTAGSVVRVTFSGSGNTSTCHTAADGATAHSSSCTYEIQAADVSTGVQVSAPAGYVADKQTQVSLNQDVSDGRRGTVPRVLNFTDTRVPPAAGADSYRVPENKTTTLKVQRNDRTDGAPVTGVKVTQPANGHVAIGGVKVASGAPAAPAFAAAGVSPSADQPEYSAFTLKFTPTKGYTGADPFSYAVTTANGSSTAKVAVRVVAPASSASVPTASSAAQVVRNDANGNDGLARTGAPSGVLLELGGALVIAGGAAVAAGRRRRFGRHA